MRKERESLRRELELKSEDNRGEQEEGWRGYMKKVKGKEGGGKEEEWRSWRM